MPADPTRSLRATSFLRVLHPLELLAALILAAAPWAGIPIVPATITAAAIGAVGALGRRAWVVAGLWAAVSAWLAAGAPGLMPLVSRWGT